MDVSMRSPPMRYRAASNKRARSPGSPAPAERMSKRPLITPSHPWDSAYLTTKRKSIHEDEWLDQTRDLSIHSPALSNTDDVELFEGELKSHKRHPHHEDIQMNSQESDDGSHTTIQPLENHTFVTDHDPDAELIFLSMHTPRQSSTPMRHQQLSALHLTLPSQSDNSPNSLTHLAPRSAPPHITLHPATPATPTDAIRASALSLPRSPTPMAVECSPSMSSSTCGGGQKKRSAVSMGPRADCEKCRLKVPGHWMHFD